MNKEFKKIINGSEIRYILESATAGATSSGAVASNTGTVGKVQKRGNILAQENNKDQIPGNKPRNFVAKNAKMGGAGAHKDKKKDQKQGKEKHKKPYMESLRSRIDDLKTRLSEMQGVAEGSTTRGGFGGSAGQAQHEIQWLQNKIETLKPLLAKKPSVARQIKDLERQIRERELAIAYQKEGVAEGSLDESKIHNVIMAFAVLGGALIGGASGIQSHHNKQRWMRAYEQIKQTDPATAEQVKQLVNKYKSQPLKWGPDIDSSRKIEKIISDFENQKLKDQLPEQGVAEDSNDISVGDYVSYDDGPGTDRWEVVSIEGNRVELRNDQGGTTFADINDVLKEQGVAEGYREYDELRNKIEQILIKVYDKYGTRDEILDVAKPMAQKVAQQMGLEKYFDEIWMNALASHDVDTNFGDNDDEFDYTDHSMRKGERGMEEGASDYVGNAIEDLRASKPGLDRETFLDELYFYIDAQYGKQAADAAFSREDDATFDEWYDSYSDMAETATDSYMESLSESLQKVLSEKAPPGDKYERMVKHIKKGYAKDGKISDKEKSIAYATAWKAKNKAKK